MGMDISITVGPYIKVTGKKEINEIKVKRVCPNHPNQKQENAKFCSTCGTEIQNEDYTETKILNPARAIWETDLADSLRSPEGMESIFLPEAKVPNRIKVNQYGDSIDLSSSEDLKIEQIKWMEENYTEEIDFFVENFGRENVFVRWGIVTYWS
jgi:predicted adenine nucleotide alpha hydrolase (AANH) superfamily ATPase